MQAGEGSLGRIFVLRLEEGDRIPNAIEDFARNKDIRNAMLIYLGGINDGSRMVVGPEEGRGDDIVPGVFTLNGIQEIVGVGTLFRDEEDNPTLHMHAATGRDGGASVECTNAGVEVWLVGEAVLVEINGLEAKRVQDIRSGLKLLQLKAGR